MALLGVLGKRGPRAGLAIALALTAQVTVLPAPAGAQELALRRVMLSAGGVGYFEYEAEVDGDATLPLRVRLDQVDDVLKSIVVYDDRGAAGEISLPGREPLTQVFRDLPFGPEALASPVALLNALPGAEIRATGPREIAGRLVRVVPETTSLPAGGGTLIRHRVSLMTAAGLQTFVFEDAEAVVFTNAELRAQIDGALAAVAEHRVRDQRTLQVVSRGRGTRTVRVGYVVAAPLWKASYRLTLADAETRLQGWAVIENLSGHDWQEVELTIVSGNPVTFRQALYAAYYARRPEVPVEVLGRLLPRPDTGSLDLEAPAGAAAEEEFRKAQLGFEGEDGMSQRAGELYVRGGRSGEVTMTLDESAAPMTIRPGPARLVAAASQEAATQVTFRIPHAVTVTSGQTVLVPVIDRALPAERVGLFQAAVHARHPLAAVRLDNDGETGLPAGVVTLYESAGGGATYVGDAQLSTLPAGERRLVSYALDHKTLIDREVAAKQAVARGRIVDGTLELTYEDEQTTVYRIKAPAREDRELLIEHPRRQGWKLVEPDPEDAELTEDHYRIRRKVAAGAQADVKVRLTAPRIQTFALVGQTEEFYLAYAGNGELDEDLRGAFAEMARLRAVVAGHERRLAELEGERARIHEEQRRIRDNLGRITQGSDLHTRYIEKLNLQEDEIEAIDAKTEATREALAAAEAALADYIRGLEL